MFSTTHVLFELLDLAVGMVKFLLRFLNISEKVRLWLIGAFNKALVQLDISLTILNLLLKLKNFSMKSLSLLLFLLKAIRKQETLLNSEILYSRRECGRHLQGIDQDHS